QEYKDKNFMDDIIDKFVNKFKILINDEDDKISSDKKIKIVGMINEVLKNRTYSKKAKEKFQHILENTCEDYGYDPIQEYCKICNQGDYDENWEYNLCWHFKEKIDFFQVYNFVKFFKKYCNKDHYDVVSHLFFNKDLSKLILKQCNLLCLFENVIESQDKDHNYVWEVGEGEVTISYNGKIEKYKIKSLDKKYTNERNFEIEALQIGNYRITEDGDSDLIGDKNGIQIIVQTKSSKTGQYPDIEKEYKKFINAIETQRSAKEIEIFVVTNNINIKKLKTIASADRKIVICQFNELGGYIKQIEQEYKKEMLKLSNDIYNADDCLKNPNSMKEDLLINLTKLKSQLEKISSCKVSEWSGGSINDKAVHFFRFSFITRGMKALLPAKAKNCIIITGADISCSAGIPDFISSDSLYNMIKSQYLGVFHSGKDLFDVQLLRTHDTIKRFNLFIADMKKLKRVYTQNIDNLEELVEFDVNWQFERVKNCKAQEGKAPNCPECVERIILYGDIHPKGLEISEIAKCDQDKADCLLIIETFLRIPEVKDLIKGFARAVHGRDGCIILVNTTDVANKGWNGIIDYQIE
ncbi:6412_t:CDS:10, partial [Racocetra persica]